jgi:hypothetical protein
MARDRIWREDRQRRDEQTADRDRIARENLQHRNEQTADRQRIGSENRQERDEQFVARQRINDEVRQHRDESAADRDRIARENRQNRDESSYERGEVRAERRSERASLRRRVAENWTHAGRARVYEQEAENFAEGTAEHDTLMARAASERQHSFFGRPSGRVLMMQTMFGLWEASRAARGLQMITNPSGIGSEQIMAHQMQGAQLTASGIYGSMAAEGLELARMAGFNVPTISRLAESQDQARMSLARTASGVENKINLDARLRGQVNSIYAESAAARVTNPAMQRRIGFNRQAADEVIEYDRTMDEMSNKYNSLSGADQQTPEAIQLRDRIETMRKNRDRTRNAVFQRRDVQIQQDITNQSMLRKLHVFDPPVSVMKLR